MKVQKFAGILIIIFGIVFALIQTQNILVPFIISILLWFLIKEIRSFIDKNNWIKNKIPRWIKTITASIILIATLSILTNLLVYNITNLSESIPTYNQNISSIGKKIQNNTGINVVEKINGYSENINFESILTKIINSISDILSSAFMIILYLLFILMEESTFLKKLKAMYPDKEKLNRTTEILYNIDESISKYISIKTILSFTTAILSYAALLIIDIDAALFWAFLIFILNFIPSIGSLIATLFPAIMALLQHGNETFTPFYLVLIFIGLIQIIIGNLLEPKLMGKSLNISSLVVIISLTVWGVIWGVVGMILSVPITVIMILIFSHFEPTKNIAILLSKDGEINTQN